MKSIHYILSILLVVILSCKNNSETNKKTTDKTSEQGSTDNLNIEKKLKVALQSKSGSTATGRVFFSEKDGIVTMEAVLQGLSKGVHAIHIHEKADCSSDDGKSTGGHWNPTKQPHSKWGDTKGYHKGDIGNFVVDADGNGKVSKTTKEWCIDCGDETKDILGKSIIVHQGADDFTSQPSGAAGIRVSCGGIIQ